MRELPIKLRPACKDYLWGGNKLRERYGKQSEQAVIAESWELSCHPDGPSVVASGPYSGATLPEYLSRPGLLGRDCERFEAFPILIKLIDAAGDLSVQVHPDNAYARRVEGSYGKTEMWVVLECEPGAALYHGFCRDVTREEVADAIRQNTITQLLRRVPVSPGQVFFIEAGTVHAIGAGITLAEIQQNSNTTYRVYDYGRRDKAGNLRELHIEKALEVMTLTPPAEQAQHPYQQRAGYRRRLLAACDYFTVYELQLAGQALLSAGPESFVSLLCVEGEGTLCSPGQALPFGKGDSLFIPAGLGEYQLAGQARVLLTTV